MPIVKCNCPSCQTLLQIAQALPVQVRCPRCNATFTLGAVPAPAQAPIPRPLIPVGAIQTAGARAGGAGASAPPVRLAPPRPGRPGGGGRGLLLWMGVGGGALLLTVVLVLVLALGKSDAEGEPQGGGGISPPPLSPQQRKINGAIERGVAYLKTRLLDGSQLHTVGDGRGGGAHPGAVALGGLTLLECNVKADDAALQHALLAVRGQARQLTFTYSIAAAILFLDRFNNPKERPVDASDRELIKSMALRLIAGQNGKGGWAYYCQVLSPASEGDLLTQLQQDRFRPGNFFVPGQMAGRDDNSIGQFATLALWAARKHGIPVRASLKAVEARYRPRQNTDGSWQYNDFNRFLRDTSTCAGLIGLAVARGVEAEGPQQGKAPAGDLMKDPAVEKGLRYVAQVVGKKAAVTEEERTKRRAHTAKMERLLGEVEKAAPFDKQRLIQQLIPLDRAALLRGIYFDGDNWGDLYFLWSLERMAVIYDLKKIGDKDWYEWGSEIILAHQQQDGSWSERFPGVPDTCFALLFLRRANLVKDLTDKLREGRPGVPAVGEIPAVPGGPAPAPRKE